MKSINFPEATNKIAEHQEQFNTVISQWNPDEQSVNMCFELDEEEMKQLNKTKRVWFKQITGGKRMNPILISPWKEAVIKPRKEIGTLNDIDTTTPEGKLLFASLAMMTTMEENRDKEPEVVLAMINEMKNQINFGS